MAVWNTPVDFRAMYRNAVNKGRFSFVKILKAKKKSEQIKYLCRKSNNINLNKKKKEKNLGVQHSRLYSNRYITLLSIYIKKTVAGNNNAIHCVRIHFSKNS